VEHGPTLADRAFDAADIMFRTICQWTLDSRTCHATISDSRWRHFYLVNGTRA